MGMNKKTCDYCENNFAGANYERPSEGGVIFRGKSIAMSFICRRCGGTFCADCRLPEQHDCHGLEKNRITVLLDDIIIKNDLEEQ